VIRRVFRAVPEDVLAGPVPQPGSESAGDTRRRQGESLISAYLDTFLPVSGETIQALAAFFAASVTYQTAVALRKGNLALPPALVALGKYAAPIAEAAGHGRREGESGACIAHIQKGADNFEAPGLFSQFIGSLLNLVSKSLREGVPLPDRIWFSGIVKKLAGEAETAVGIYNQSPALALDRFGAEFSRTMAGL
jgi:DNA polymerase-3 subunit gamma/tau